MGIPDEKKVVTQSLGSRWYHNKLAAVDMLRLDLIHPVISGNKWYKLRYNLQYAIAQGFETLLTFGGGYSNHLAATACAAKIFGLRSVGVVRGKYASLTPTLLACEQDGMELHFVTQAEYNRKNDPEWVDTLIAPYSRVYVIPEGGANEQGIAGAGEIAKFCGPQYTHIALSVGSGATFTGLRQQLSNNQSMLGLIPMKNGIAALSAPLCAKDNREKVTLFDRWHFGGFGKWNPELLHFMNDFYSIHAIPTDIVYTGKMMFGIRQLIQEGFFNENDRLLCIHTGGLQGNASVKEALIF